MLSSSSGFIFLHFYLSIIVHIRSLWHPNHHRCHRLHRLLLVQTRPHQPHHRRTLLLHLHLQLISPIFVISRFPSFKLTETSLQHHAFYADLRQNLHLLPCTANGILSPPLILLLSVDHTVVSTQRRKSHSRQAHRHLCDLIKTRRLHLLCRMSHVMHVVRRVISRIILRVQRRHHHLLRRTHSPGFPLIVVLHLLLRLLPLVCNFAHHSSEHHLLLIFFHLPHHHRSKRSTLSMRTTVHQCQHQSVISLRSIDVYLLKS